MEPTGVSTHFHDVEPGWTCVYFESAPRHKRSRYHALLRALEGWRERNPTRRIERIQFVKNQGVVRGLNILWSLFEHLVEQSSIAHFQIDEEVRDLYGHEYNEALMRDATAFALDVALPAENIALVSRRKIAIVITRHDRQAYVMTLDKLVATLEPHFARSFLKEFDRWSLHNEKGFFSAMLPDSHHF